MPVKARPIAVETVWNWTGFYVGGTAGGGRGRPHHEDVGNPAFASTTFTMSGAVAGGTVGFNYQLNRLVLGVEADGSWANIKGSGPDSPNYNCDVVCRTEIRSFYTARGRVGVTLYDRILAYGTAGAAWSKIFGGDGFSTVGTATKSGWTAGGGLEFAATQNLSFKAEYLHVRVSNFHINPFGGCDSCSTVNNDYDVFRLGINYRFWGGGPVVARY